MSKRVCCLYRVSTGKQVDYDSNNEADIPMQRKACHKFANEMGWEIVHEEQEDGVSGHKVRAEDNIGNFIFTDTQFLFITYGISITFSEA